MGGERDSSSSEEPPASSISRRERLSSGWKARGGRSGRGAIDRARRKRSAAVNSSARQQHLGFGAALEVDSEALAAQLQTEAPAIDVQALARELTKALADAGLGLA